MPAETMFVQGVGAPPPTTDEMPLIISASHRSLGWGESLMKIVFCKSACDLILAGHPAQAAAEAIIKRLEERVDGLGGIILVDKQGKIGHAFNTPRMARAWVTPDGDIESAV